MKKFTDVIGVWILPLLISFLVLSVPSFIIGFSFENVSDKSLYYTCFYLLFVPFIINNLILDKVSRYVASTKYKDLKSLPKVLDPSNFLTKLFAKILTIAVIAFGAGMVLLDITWINGDLYLNRLVAVSMPAGIFLTINYVSYFFLLGRQLSKVVERNKQLEGYDGKAEGE
mgnify:CR=1 FL=1